MFMFIKFYVYLISQYSEADLIQKHKKIYPPGSHGKRRWWRFY